MWQSQKKKILSIEEIIFMLSIYSTIGLIQILVSPFYSGSSTLAVRFTNIADFACTVTQALYPLSALINCHTAV